MNKDCNIIFTHKDITCPAGYEIIDNRKSDLDHRLWSEIAGMKILYDRIKKMEDDARNGNKTAEIPEWINLNHYRRMFDKDCYHRVYVAQPLVFQCTLAQHYQHFHNIKDLSICGEALKETFPHLVPTFEMVLNRNILIPYIIGIMPTGQFMDYFTFLYTVLNKTLEKMNCKTYEEVMERIKTVEGYNVDVTGRDNKPEYQVRILSFLAERLATLYWTHCSQQLPVFPAKVNLLEEGQKI